MSSLSLAVRQFKMRSEKVALSNLTNHIKAAPTPTSFFAFHDTTNALKMAGTRRSTRQAASLAAKYNEDSSSSSEKAEPKRSAKKQTRQKRAREEDAEEDVRGKGNTSVTLTNHSSLILLC